MSAMSAPDTAKGRLQRAVLAIYREHADRGELPTSGRFIFYEAEQRGIVIKHRGINPKTGQPYKRTAAQNISDALTVLREAGLVPWEAITDETRTLRQWEFAADVYSYIAGLLDSARIDAWGGRPAPLILCESRSLAGVLRAVAAEYLCPLAATNGQCGGFLRTDIAPLLTGGRAVLYLGDYDHQGGQIEANTRRVLEGLAGAASWRRVTITREQIDERGLTPISKSDDRYRPLRWHDAWETEALGQGTVIALMRTALDDLLPEPLDRVRVREREQRAALASRLTGWSGR
jgi:hypothetical protein